jgi:hypothetical protein
MQKMLKKIKKSTAFHFAHAVVVGMVVDQVFPLYEEPIKFLVLAGVLAALLIAYGDAMETEGQA